MTFKEIMSVTGQPGLFKFVSQGRSGFIVEALIDGKRTNIPQTTKASTLKDVSIFTDAEDVSLGNVLLAIRDKCESKSAFNPKTVTEPELRAFFESVLPNYDKERVHLSDIRKIVSWYNLLQQCGVLDFEATDEDAEAEGTVDGEKMPAVASSTAPKSTPKPIAKPVPHASTKAAGSAGKINAPRKAQ